MTRTQTTVYDCPCLDSRKSFYGKARIEATDDGTHTLISYNTRVASYNVVTGEFKRLWAGYSATTQRHVNSFICHMGAPVETGKAAWDNMEVQ